MFVFPEHELICENRKGVFERNLSTFGALWKFTDVKNSLHLGGSKVIKNMGFGA